MKGKLIVLGLLLLCFTGAMAKETQTFPDNRSDNPGMQDDLLNGPKKDYYPNGKIRREYVLKNGKIDGSYKFYDELGRLVSDQYYKNGEPNGYLKTYYENGQLKGEMNMKSGGDISGPSKEYYEDGTLKKESMISGQLPEMSVQSKLYSKDGKLQEESTVSRGQLVYAIVYDQQGRVTSEQKPGQIISYWYENDTGKQHTSINGVEQK